MKKLWLGLFLAHQIAYASFFSGGGSSSGGGGGSGLTSINADTTAAQLITSDSAGTDIAVATAGGTTTISVPSASALNRGVVTIGAQVLAGVKTLSSAPIFSSLTATTVPYLDASKALTSSAVTPTELGYLSGVTSALQTQLAAKANSAGPSLSGSVTFSGGTASTVPYLDASKILTSSAVTPTELGYLSGVTSALQTQLGLLAPKANPSFTGVAGFATGSAAAPSVTQTSDPDNGMYFGTNQVLFATAGTQRLSIGATGNILWDATGTRYYDVSQHNFVFPLASAAGAPGSGGSDGLVLGNCIIQASDTADRIRTTCPASGRFFWYFAGTNVVELTQSRVLFMDTSGTNDMTIDMQPGKDTSNVVRAGGNMKSNTTAVGNGADATEDNLITYSLPASTLSTNGDFVEVEAFGTTAANADNKTVACYFGATKVYSSPAAVALNAKDWRIHFTVIRTGATTQVATGNGSSSDTTLWPGSALYTTPGETLSGAITLKCTGTDASSTANGVVQKALIVKRFPRGN